MSEALHLDAQTRVIEATEFGGSILVIHGDGVLKAYDAGTGNLVSTTPEGSYFSLARDGSFLWALRWREPPVQDAPSTVILTRRTADGATSEAPPITFGPNEGFAALVSTAAGPIILSSAQYFRLENGEWRASPLSQQIARGFSRSHALLADGHTLYMGFDNGEWGGGLHRVDLTTGDVDVVDQRENGSLCAGPLNSSCDPVTGVIADPSHEDCVIASIALAHLGMQTGRILRVCGSDVRVIFERELTPPSEPVPPGYTRVFLPGQTIPIYGLAGSSEGFWAMTEEALFHFSAAGRFVEERPIDLKQIGDLRMDRSVPGSLIVSGPPARTIHTRIPEQPYAMEIRIGGGIPILASQSPH